MYKDGKIVQRAKGTVPLQKRYLDEMPGIMLQDVWNDIKSVQVTEEILKPLYEDLNTPGYIANLHKLYENASKGKDKELFISACKFIGLLNEDNNQWQKYKKDKATINEAEINNTINLRNKARANKDYKEADRIRDELFDKGVLIEDKDGKTLWKFK